jgi:nitrogen fixation protein FixH
MRKQSRATLSWRQILILIVVEFAVVFGVLVIFQFLSLTSYSPFVAGAVAGGASIAVNLLINRHERTSKKSQNAHI